MSTQKARLPQLDGGLFLTDGGIETDLIFNDGFELPYFAAFHLLQTEKGMAALRAYFARYAAIARKAGIGFILESPTWRASARLGRQARLLQAGAGGGQCQVDRADRGAAHRAWICAHADGGERLRRPARRRL